MAPKESWLHTARFLPVGLCKGHCVRKRTSNLQDLFHGFTAERASVTRDMLTRMWVEHEYRRDIRRAVTGADIDVCGFKIMMLPTHFGYMWFILKPTQCCTGIIHMSLLCDCEAIAYAIFCHLGQFFMERSDYYDAPIGKVLHFIQSVGLMKG
jgi:hypothetical protein